MTRWPISSRINIGAARGHIPDTLDADHRRVTVQRGINAHGLEHVGEVEPRGHDSNLDLVVLRRYSLHRVHRQCVQPPGLIDLQPDRADATKIHHGAAWLDGEHTVHRCRHAHQPVHIPLPVPQGHLVMVWIGEKFVDQCSGRPTAVGVDVNDGRFQFRVFEGQHPRDAAKCRLRQGHSITRIELLGTPRHDPQPRAVSGADLRQRLDNVGDEQRPRLRELQLLRIRQRLIDWPGRAHDDNRVPRDVLSCQRTPELRLVTRRHDMAMRRVLREPRPHSTQQRVTVGVITDQQHSVDVAGRLVEIHRFPFQREHVASEPIPGSRRP